MFLSAVIPGSPVFLLLLLLLWTFYVDNAPWFTSFFHFTALNHVYLLFNSCSSRFILPIWSFSCFPPPSLDHRHGPGYPTQLPLLALRCCAPLAPPAPLYWGGGPQASAIRGPHKTRAGLGGSQSWSAHLARAWKIWRSKSFLFLLVSCSYSCWHWPCILDVCGRSLKSLLE